MDFKCKFCKETYDLPVTKPQLLRHSFGELAQNVFPDLTAAERELIISGTCGTCWTEMFSQDDEDSEEENIITINV